MNFQTATYICSSTTIVGGYEMRINRLLLLLLMSLVLLLGGCFQGEQQVKDMDVPEDVEVVEDNEEAEEATEEDDADEADEEEEQQETEISESAETIARDIYILDEDGMVVPQSFELPKAESAAKQAVEYMVIDGPVTELLPSGFQAILPVGTSVLGVNLKEDGTLIVDLSEEFKEYEADNELHIIEAMTHTLTQFDDVERIKLWINGHEVDEMPQEGTPISAGYSKANGINVMTTEKPDVAHSQVATMYFPKQRHEHLYYVPITQYLHDKDTDMVTFIVEALLHQQGAVNEFIDVFNDETTLLKKPHVRDGVVQLEFSEHILLNPEKGVIANDVMETLVRSLTAQEGIDAIEVTVESEQVLVNESGLTYKQPVTAEDFTNAEKM